MILPIFVQKNDKAINIGDSNECFVTSISLHCKIDAVGVAWWNA